MISLPYLNISTSQYLWIPRTVFMHMLVHSTDNSSTEQYGFLACQRAIRETIPVLWRRYRLRGPKWCFAIRDHFSCESKNLVYCKSCCHWWNRTRPGRRFSEGLQSVPNNTPAFPVAQHFNSTSNPQVTVFVMSRCGICSYSMLLKHPTKAAWNEDHFPTGNCSARCTEYWFQLHLNYNFMQARAIRISRHTSVSIWRLCGYCAF